MKNNIFFYFTIALQLIAIQLFTQNLKPQDCYQTIVFENETRNYYLYIPKSIDKTKPFPLLFSFHGFGGNAKSMFYSGMNKIADNECFAICYPNGVEKKWNVGGKIFDNKKNDVAFVSFLIDEISEKYNINNEAIFAYGLSNGGFMSYKLACDLSEKIKAIASITGSITQQIVDNCEMKNVVPILQIHGTKDKTVSFFNENKYYKSVKQTLNFFTRKYNCSSSKKNYVYKKDCEQKEIIISEPQNCDAKIKLINVKNGVHELFCFSNEEIWWFFYDAINN